MKKKYSFAANLVMVCSIMLASGCDPIYIPDPIDPRLPKYTDEGNNVAGVLINDTIWRSNYYSYPFNSTYRPTVNYSRDRDSLVIIFYGTHGNNESVTTISFGLRGTGVSNVSELSRLNDRKFQLGNADNLVKLERNPGCNDMGSGQLYFRQVKHHIEPEYAILSGTFGFTIIDPVCGDKMATFGRFDFRIDVVGSL